MTNREVALIVRDARSSGWVKSEDDFVPYILRRGVTLEEYRRYAWRKTAWWCVLCGLAMAAIWVATEILTGRAG